MHSESVYAVTWEAAYSIHQENLKMKNAVRMWTYDPVLTDKKTSLHKHKMGACNSMLGYLISTC